MLDGDHVLATFKVHQGGVARGDIFGAIESARRAFIVSTDPWHEVQPGAYEVVIRPVAADEPAVDEPPAAAPDLEAAEAAADETPQDTESSVSEQPKARPLTPPPAADIADLMD